MSSAWERVAAASEIPVGKTKSFMMGAEEIMVANVDGTFYALRNKCTHMGCPLSRGTLNGKIVTCPCHGSKFDVTTGAVARPPAMVPEATFQVKLQDASVFVRKPD